MWRLGIVAVALAVLLRLEACGPTVTVQNSTKIPVRVIVGSGDKQEALSPSPGESSTAEVSEGPYRVTAIRDDEWIAYARLTRKLLNDQLANSQNLSGPQLLDVVQRLKDIAARMAQFEAAAGKASRCAGTVSSDGGGSAVVSLGPDGTLVVSCK